MHQFRSFVDSIFWKTKNKVQIPCFVNLGDCIVWNHNICTVKTKIHNIYFPYSSNRELLRQTTELPPSSRRHHRSPPKETSSCAKRWNNTTVERGMQSICVYSGCKWRRKSRVWVLCAFYIILKNIRDRFIFI